MILLLYFFYYCLSLIICRVFQALFDVSMQKRLSKQNKKDQRERLLGVTEESKIKEKTTHNTQLEEYFYL